MPQDKLHVPRSTEDTTEPATHAYGRCPVLELRVIVFRQGQELQLIRFSDFAVETGVGPCRLESIEER